jgi:nitrate reductase NapE component
MPISHLKSLDGRIDSMNRRRTMSLVVIFLSTVMWAALIAEYLNVKDIPNASHHLTTYFIVDVIIFQLALWLTLVYRNILGVLLFIVLIGFYVWMYEISDVFPPQKAASIFAWELAQPYLN